MAVCDSPYWVVPSNGAKEKVPVPCGRCPPCKQRRVYSWVFRLLQEQKVSTAAHFITLTYDTRFVPITKNGFMSLHKPHYQLFMKRLRNLCPDVKLKYYAVGEYGTRGKRPHYHAIIFNLPDPEMVADAWMIDSKEHGRVMIGQVHVGEVSSDSIAYCMKYIDKFTDKRQHGRDDREPEFALMSKGLGANYLSDDIKAYHKADITRMFVTELGGRRIPMPRYYRDKVYDPWEKLQQVAYIQKEVEKTDDLRRMEFYREHVTPFGEIRFSYEQWQASQRHGRYEHFYSNQKVRDI